MTDSLTTSPKRKAIHDDHETSNKRNTWTVAYRSPNRSSSKCEITAKVENTAMELDPNYDISFAIIIAPAAAGEGGPSTKHAYTSKINMAADESTPSLSLSSTGLLSDIEPNSETDPLIQALTKHADQERHEGNEERSIPAVTIRSTTGSDDEDEDEDEDDDTSPKPMKLSIRPSSLLGRSAEHPSCSEVLWRGVPAVLEEYQHKLSRAPPPVRLEMKVILTQPERWAVTLDVSCSYNGFPVGRASGTLIDRESIRHAFYQSMESLGKPAGYRIAELLDHHGFVRWPIKEHYLRAHRGVWDDHLDLGDLLQVDSLFVREDWRRRSVGGLLLTTLVERARRMAADLNLAYVLPAPDGLWRADEANAGVRSFFHETGWTRVAETGWFAMDVSPEDEGSDGSPSW